MTKKEYTTFIWWYHPAIGFKWIEIVTEAIEMYLGETIATFNTGDGVKQIASLSTVMEVS
jgi:hypothetical protein